MSFPLLELQQAQVSNGKQRHPLSQVDYVCLKLKGQQSWAELLGRLVQMAALRDILGLMSHLLGLS